jgi:hypothetical protein
VPTIKISKAPRMKTVSNLFDLLEKSDLSSDDSSFGSSLVSRRPIRRSTTRQLFESSSGVGSEDSDAAKGKTDRATPEELRACKPALYFNVHAVDDVSYKPIR